MLHSPSAGGTAAAAPGWRSGSAGSGWWRFSCWCWQVMTETTIWAFVADAPRQAADIGDRMFPPRLSYLPELLVPLWDTLNMAILGTLLGVILAVPTAFLAARNTTPSALLLRPLALFVIVASRSNQFADLGAASGCDPRSRHPRRDHRDRAALHRLHRQAALRGDRGDRCPADRGDQGHGGLARTGARLRHRAADPAGLLGITVFRWDINIRESAILGLVGAGGLGLKLNASLNVLAWPQVTMILLVILATVVLSEWVSAKVRSAVI